MTAGGGNVRLVSGTPRWVSRLLAAVAAVAVLAGCVLVVAVHAGAAG